MSHILVTGANGFVGRALVARLLAAGNHALTLIDQSFDGAQALPGVRCLRGSFGDSALLDDALRTPVDTVFHLASVPGALAERDALLGRAVNLDATLLLAHRLAGQCARTARAPRVVFASSIAVYGAFDGPMHEDRLPQPALSYGAHKWVAEILLADLSRRGELDAVSVRLPGIVARPAAESGHGSAFMSRIMHAVAAGEHYDCPVSADATCWWMSLPCCIDNLLHAAAMPATGRAWQLPVLHLNVRQVIDALSRHVDRNGHALVAWAPDARIEALFGRCPPLDTPAALAAGFCHDGDAGRLVAAALGSPPAR